jgi:hypothetical protein
LYKSKIKMTQVILILVDPRVPLHTQLPIYAFQHHHPKLDLMRQCEVRTIVVHDTVTTKPCVHVQLNGMRAIDFGPN